MGSSFNYRTYTGTREYAIKRWNSDVEDAEYESGHGGNYTGSISELGRGFTEVGKIFKNEDEAVEYIEEHHSKWDGAMAVCYYKQGGIAKSSANKKAKLEEKLKTAIRYSNQLKEKLINEIKNAKSKLIGCTKCGSKLNRKYINHNGACPLCSNSLLSATAKKRIQVSWDKAKKAEKEFKGYKPKTSKSATTKVWVIGGHCSS